MKSTLMKSTFLSIACTGIMTVLMHGNVNAQIALNKPVNAGVRFKTEKPDFHESKVSPAASVDFRTVKDFNKKFASVNNVVWYATDRGYTAEFSANSIKSTVVYGKNGNWFYTIHRYHEEKLPAAIRSRVKSTYFDYAISCISEVQGPQQEEPVYILNLRYNNNFKTVGVCGDDMRVVAEYHSDN